MAKQQTEMLTHDQIWGAMDRLAERSGLSPSGLAKASGLDPTTFNKSKRITPEGRPRWPSTESIAKSLDAAGPTIHGFGSLIVHGESAAQTIPRITFAHAASAFDADGVPAGKGWDAFAFPAI